MDKTKIFVKWLARILGGAALLFYGIYFMQKGDFDFSHGLNMHRQQVLLLLFFALFSLVFAWFKEKEGGIALCIAGIIIGLNVFYSAGMNTPWILLVYSAPMVVPGLMFWWVADEAKQI